MSRRPVSLSEIQLSVMHALWRQGQADIQMVVEAMAADGRELAYTTVATLLKRLEKRGLVAHEKSGRKQIFHAQVTESEVRESMVSGLIGSLFRGDPQALASHLVENHDMDESDLRALRQLIDTSDKS